jgi:hypothetical protein
MSVSRLMKNYEQEYWNTGTMELKNDYENSSDPIFHHSIVPLIF